MRTPVFDLDVMHTRDLVRFAVIAPVRYADLDPSDHVIQANYLAYLKECRLAVCRDVEAKAAFIRGELD